MKVKKFLSVSFFAILLIVLSANPGLTEEGSALTEASVEVLPVESSLIGADTSAAEDPDDLYDDDFNDEFDDDFDDEVKAIWDPIEPFNRAIFVFNDKMYFWVVKPVARGYNFVVPEKGRVAIDRFFVNLATPVRFVNSLLQLKSGKAGSEALRFVINTTVGVLGFMDPARDRWEICLNDEDLGQTFGRYGSGPGFYIVWPLLGPSSVRDTLGMAGDFFLKPTTYIFEGDAAARLGVLAFEKENRISLNIGVYEGLKKDAIDPYSYIRDIYHQYRENKVRE